MRQFILLFTGLLFGLINVAQAHLEGVTDSHILIGESAVNIVYTVPLEFINSVTEQSNITTKDIAENAFHVSNNGVVCQPTVSKQVVLDNIKSLQIELDYLCQQSLETLVLDYSFLIAQFNDHQNFTQLTIAGRHQNVIFDIDLAIYRMNVSDALSNWGIALQGFDTLQSVEKLPIAASLKQATYFFNLGVKHILLGFDHLMFLLALLLLPLRFKELFALITTFTVAHSITLGLSVLDVINLPVLIVESIIAFSIVYVAFENIWEVRRQKVTNNNEVHSPWKRRLLVTFAFGLLHGFGFAYILKEVGLGDQVFAALLMFNLGVESGQIFAIICFSPLLYLLYKYSKNSPWLVIVSSLMIGLTGIVWLMQRI